MNDFIDLDGTCLRSIHANDGIPLDEEKIGEMYLSEPPYEAVVDFILYGDFPLQCDGCAELEPVGTCNGCSTGRGLVPGAMRTFVTGRKSKHASETRAWIKKCFHLDDGQYQIHFIGFVDYPTYVKSKAKKMVELIVGSDDNFIRVFEDDEKVVEEVEKMLAGLDKRQVMHVCFVLVRGGKMWKRDMLLI